MYTPWSGSLLPKNLLARSPFITATNKNLSYGVPSLPSGKFLLLAATFFGAGLLIRSSNKEVS
ncbi:MAG: hypothetical protein ACJAWN_001362 [Neolewinella sp.]